MGIIFKTRGVIIFSNKLLNLIILLIFYFAILWLLSTIYYKLFKFETKKEILTKKEFKCFLMKKKAYKRKISKKENRIPIASLKKLEELNKKGEKLNNEFYKGGVFFKSYIVFLLFSIYYGTYLGLPIWAIKNSLK